MDKLFHLSHRTTVAIENSLEHLNDESLFGSLMTDHNLIEEGNIVLGSDLDDSANNHEDEIVFHKPIPVTDSIDGELSDDGELTNDDPIQTPSNTTMSFGCQVTWHWNKRKQCIEHEYAIAAWALCVMASVRTDVRERLSGVHRDAIADVVTRLHMAPCPNQNPTIHNMLPHKIIDTFWNEFKAFQNCTHPYHDMSCWASSDYLSGKSYLWHEKCSLPYTVVLGFVGCRVTSKLCGIGPAERSWGGVKQIKDGVRSHMGAESTEKRSVIYVTAKIQESRMRQEQMEKFAAATGNDTMFGEDDINFDLQLEKFGVDTNILKEPAVQHIFRAWVEDWEQDARKNNYVVAEARLLLKYRGLVFHDPDTDNGFSIYDQNMEFHRGRGNGWFVLRVCSTNAVEDEGFLLDIACELIGGTPQKEGIQVMFRENQE